LATPKQKRPHHHQHHHRDDRVFKVVNASESQWFAGR
jgi:hypothetical protein